MGHRSPRRTEIDSKKKKSLSLTTVVVQVRFRQPFLLSHTLLTSRTPLVIARPSRLTTPELRAAV